MGRPGAAEMALRQELSGIYRRGGMRAPGGMVERTIQLMGARRKRRVGAGARAEPGAARVE